MIFYGIFKLLRWLYGWGDEYSDITRLAMTTLSGFEMIAVSLVLIVFLFVEMPGIIKKWRNK
jgi:hypothetical protein